MKRAPLLLAACSVLAIVLAGIAAIIRAWELFQNSATMPALAALAMVLGLYSYLSIATPSRKSIGGLAVVLVLFLAISLAYVYGGQWLDLARLAWALSPEVAAVLGGLAVGMVWQVGREAQERADALPIATLDAETRKLQAQNERYRLETERKGLVATITETHVRQVTAPIAQEPALALAEPRTCDRCGRTFGKPQSLSAHKRFCRKEVT